MDRFHRDFKKFKIHVLEDIEVGKMAPLAIAEHCYAIGWHHCQASRPGRKVKEIEELEGRTSKSINNEDVICPFCKRERPGNFITQCYGCGRYIKSTGGKLTPVS